MQKTKNNSRRNFRELMRKSKDNRRFSNQVMANVNMFLNKSSSIFPKNTKNQFSTRNLFSKTTQNFNKADSSKRSSRKQKAQPSLNSFNDKNIINISKNPSSYNSAFNRITPINKVSAVTRLKDLTSPQQNPEKSTILEKIIKPTFPKIQRETVAKKLSIPSIKENKENIFAGRNLDSNIAKKTPKNIKDKISVKSPDLNSSNINISPNISVEVNQKNGFSDFNKIWQEIGNRLNSEINSSASGFH